MSDINNIIAAQHINSTVEELVDTYYFFNYELDEKEAKRQKEWEVLLAQREYEKDNTNFEDVEKDIEKDLEMFLTLSFSELLQELKICSRNTDCIGEEAKICLLEEELKERARNNKVLKLRLPLSLLF